MAPQHPSSLLPHRSQIDLEIFGQLLEMDDEEGDTERDFSRELVKNFFEENRPVFDSMQAALNPPNLTLLSTTSHTLRGASLTLGLSRLGAKCEALRNLARGKSEDGAREVWVAGQALDERVVRRLGELVGEARSEFESVEGVMRWFYGGW